MRLRCGGDFRPLSPFSLRLSTPFGQRISRVDLDCSVMSGWTSVSARRLRSRISLTAVTDFSRVASHPFTPRTTHTLGVMQRRWHQHDTILHWKREVIRTHLGDLARARRKFTTSSTQKHGNVDAPKAGEESVFHLPAEYLHC